jgi:hypothetical protein
VFSPGVSGAPFKPLLADTGNDVKGESILLSVESVAGWDYWAFGRLDLADIKKYTLPKFYLPGLRVATVSEAL